MMKHVYVAIIIIIIHHCLLKISDSDIIKYTQLGHINSTTVVSLLLIVVLLLFKNPMLLSIWYHGIMLPFIKWMSFSCADSMCYHWSLYHGQTAVHSVYSVYF